MQRSPSHDVPDDAGAVRAGRHALFVITLDFDARDRAPVLLHGLQQPMTFRLQFPDANLKRAQNSDVTRSRRTSRRENFEIDRCATTKGSWADRYPSQELLFVFVHVTMTPSDACVLIGPISLTIPFPPPLMILLQLLVPAMAVTPMLCAS